MKKYVITSAQAKAKPHYSFMRSLQNYSKLNDAELMVLPMIGKEAAQDLDELDGFFHKCNVMAGDQKLNDNLQVKQMYVRPYQIDPITGLNRFAQRETTLIFASPKQRLKPIPHSNKKHPKFLTTTGACTVPNYATGEDVSAERRRLGNIAKLDHVYGGIVVELENDKIFHMRHIKANHKGEFVDLGQRYSPKGVKNSQLEAMVVGDWHTGRSLTSVKDETMNMIEAYDPKKIILHDFFDGHSVSHWFEKKPFTDKLFQQSDKHFHLLDKELKHCYRDLQKFLEVSNGTIHILSSNHLEFLDRYLNEARFRFDPPNVRTATKLLSYMMDKEDNSPFMEGLRLQGPLDDRVKFVKRDQDLKVRGFQLGAHGDKGPAMGRGSINSKENDWGKSISGHVHKAQIQRNTFTVGASTSINPYYMKGQPSDSTNTHALLWDNSAVQLINIINGKHRI